MTMENWTIPAPTTGASVKEGLRRCKGSGIGEHKWRQATVAADERSPHIRPRLVLFCERCADIRTVEVPHP